MTDLNRIIDYIEKTDMIDPNKSFEYAKICSQFLRDPLKEEDGRKIIINFLNNWEKLDISTKEMWTDLIEAAGFYPYLEKEKDKLVFHNTSGEIRKEYHKSNYLDTYFHEEQLVLNEILNGEKSLIVSAPTSFGKSLLIQEIVASKKYKNIVIIQPTLALIDETRKKLKRYSDYYRILVRTTQEPSTEKGNVFLFTAERVMEYTEFPKIDFFILDEFYKLSAARDEERSDVLNNALNLLINKYKSRFYLLGPNIDGISEGFAEKYNAEFIKTSYSLVDNRSIDLSSSEFGKRGIKRAIKENALFDLLWNLKNEQTIIYCSSPERVRYLSKLFYKYLESRKVPKSDELNLVEWIKTNVDSKWGLIDCLNYKIGIYDGALQKHITSSIIDYFNNNNKLSYLFCTTTIIEGVNTSAKNVVFFDKTKGYQKPIDFFDYSNIKGRSGRMMVHYVGRIYNFNTPPEKDQIIIDIPFFDQQKITDEVLIHIDDENVKNKESENYKSLKLIPPEERELFKKNGVLVNGQKTIVEILEKDIQKKHYLLSWKNKPTYQQLEYILSMAWNNLLKKGEITKPMTVKKLIFVTFNYGNNQNINQLVYDNYRYFRKLEENNKKSDEDVFDNAVTDAFKILRHWFHYKVPKWLNVLNSLQKYVCEKHGLEPGNYTYYSTQLENDFVRENMSILIEYGIPRSAVEKLIKHISSTLNQELIIEEIKNKKLFETVGLSEYEKEKLKENL